MSEPKTNYGNTFPNDKEFYKGNVYCTVCMTGLNGDKFDIERHKDCISCYECGERGPDKHGQKVVYNTEGIPYHPACQPCKKCGEKDNEELGKIESTGCHYSCWVDYFDLDNDIGDINDNVIDNVIDIDSFHDFDYYDEDFSHDDFSHDDFDPDSDSS